MACPATSEISADAGSNGQHQLFESVGAVPAGWAYESEFLSFEEEGDLVRIVQSLPLTEMRYRSYTAGAAV